MPPIHSSIACNLDANILLAALPLFEAGKVQAIEWSFDTIFHPAGMPEWFTELLETFGRESRLVGHGVFFSLFAGKWSGEQQQWLNRLKTLSATYRFDHVTEHFGFMTGADFHKGAPISVPFTPATLALGRDRLLRIQDACGCPVGLENLAFSYSPEEVRRHGAFLDGLLEPVNGFLILDLHNLYCQVHNFDVAPDELLALYPLDRVREMHLSGGSWSDSRMDPQRKIRRDTHDDAVPAEVFALLESALPRCPNLKYVVLEQLGSGLATEESRRAFGEDFLVMDGIVQRYAESTAGGPTDDFMPLWPVVLPPVPPEDPQLHAQQVALYTILETAADCRQAQAMLRASGLAHSDWQVEAWEPAMLETALAIAQKWKDGFKPSPAAPQRGK
jgi:uncharacterized protein (UPF0276 family)